MDKIKAVLLVLWQNHKKKVISFLLGLLFAALAILFGIPMDEIKEAAQEASKPAVVLPAQDAIVKKLKEI